MSKADRRQGTLVPRSKVSPVTAKVTTAPFLSKGVCRSSKAIRSGSRTALKGRLFGLLRLRASAGMGVCEIGLGVSRRL